MLRPKRHAKAVFAAVRHVSRPPKCLSYMTLSTLHVKSHDHVGNSCQRCTAWIQNRRAGTKASVRLDDLPQGVLHLEPLPPEQSAPSYPTVALQAQTNMRKFENCVLLTRVGGFYELYFEHAEEFGPLLNLKVAQKKTSAGPVAMAGFPFFQLDRFLKMLVQELHRYVAIAEEVPHDPANKAKAGGLLHDRKVTRIITPGTLIDEDFIDPYCNNYILAIHVDQSPAISPSNAGNDGNEQQASNMIGLAWLDLSTGQFFTQSTTLSMASSIIGRIGPREIVLDQGLQRNQDHQPFAFLAKDQHLVTYCNTFDMKPVKEWNTVLEEDLSTADAASFTGEEVAAGNILLQYVQTRLQGLRVKLQRPIRYQAQEVMGIDRSSVRGLEIHETIRDGFSVGSLSHAVRRTVTKSGARLLTEWLSAPSTSLEVINGRLDLVTRMVENQRLKERLVDLLRRCHDSQRLVQKFTLGRGDPDDLTALATTILATNELVYTLKEAENNHQTTLKPEQKDCLKRMLMRIQLDGPIKLAYRINETIDEDGVEQQHRQKDDKVGAMMALADEIAVLEGSPDDIVAVAKGRGKRKPTTLREHYLENVDVWIMNPKASAALQNLHHELNRFNIEKAVLNEELQSRLGASSLTLRWTPGLGHICHVKGKDTRNLAEIRSVSSSKSTRSFHNPEWTKLGQKMEQVRLRIRNEEQSVLQQLREQVILNLVKLRRNGEVLDELDIACSFATLAVEDRLVRPILNNTVGHKIVGGRHPAVQGGLQQQGRSFVTNDCFVGDSERLWLITGPNMAGKSTFLRQNALITIMAQVGSYVPAEYAEIGIVDQIFSRVGSADDLYRDQSTFMVEMLETATILKNATPHSFVIMDEIGRGTTPEDGTAVAFACLHHLYHINRCRTLFATHFHNLADMSSDMSGVGFYCSDVKEYEDGGFNYVHRLRRGVNRNSHALKVAKIAGLPELALSVAQKILESGKLVQDSPNNAIPSEVLNSDRGGVIGSLN